MSDVFTADKLDSMSYRELQRLARDNGMKANGKKQELIDRLVTVLVKSNKDPIQESNEGPSKQSNEEQHSNEGPSKQSNEGQQFNQQPYQESNSLQQSKGMPSTDMLNETFIIEDNKLANSTYLMTATSPTLPSDDFLLTADESILAGNIEVGSALSLDLDVTQILSSNDQENAVVKQGSVAITLSKNNQENVDMKLSKPDVKRIDTEKKVNPASVNRPSRTQIPRLGVNSGRFTESHKKLFSAMPSIEEDQVKRDERHKKVTEARSETVNRLAAAKSPRERTHSAKTLSTKKVTPSPSIKRAMTNHVPSSLSGKKRSRPISHSQEDLSSVKHAKSDQTTPTRDLSIVERLSMPKSAGSVSIPQERRSYTPNKKRFEYVDTTSMSDSEFRAYQQRQKEEEKICSPTKLF